MITLIPSKVRLGLILTGTALFSLLLISKLEPVWNVVSSQFMKFFDNGFNPYQPPWPNISTYKTQYNYDALTDSGSQLRMILAFFGACLASSITGRGILRSSAADLRNISKLWYHSCTFLAGFLFLNGLTWLYLVFGFEISFTPVLLIFSLPTICVLAFYRKQIFFNKGPLSQRSDLSSALKNLNWLSLLAWSIVAILCVTNLFQHVSDWDAVDHWIYKSEALYRHRSFYSDFFKEKYHHCYPLLWSLSTTNLSLLQGFFTDYVARMTIALLSFHFFIQIYGCSLLIGIKKTSWPLVLILICLVRIFPRSETIFLSDAELLFLTYSLACLAAFISLRKFDKNSTNLFVLVMAAGLACSKYEGFTAVFFIAAGFMISNLILSGHIMRYSRLIAGLLLVMSIPLVWQGYLRYFLGLSDGQILNHMNDAGTLDLEKMKAFLYVYFSRSNGLIISFKGAHFLIALNVLLMLFRLKNGRLKFDHIFLSITFVGFYLFSSIALHGWGANGIRNNFHTASFRLFQHGLPILVILTQSLLPSFVTLVKKIGVSDNINQKRPSFLKSLLIE